MTTETGTVPTIHASRYLQQLAKHWAHKFKVTFTPNQARIELPFGVVEMTATAEALSARLITAADEDAARARQVFEEHINRFAFREAPLLLAWDRVS